MLMVTHYEKPLVNTSLPEDKKTNTFLNKVYKKKVSNKIKQCNRKKKFQAQESFLIFPEEKIGSEQDSKCKKKKSINKLKQELFASELVSYKEISLVEQKQNHVTKISETLCPIKVISDKSSIDETSQHLVKL